MTVMLLLVVMTIIGIASLTITGSENRMSGFVRSGETAAAAAGSCIGVGVNVIRQAWMPQNAAAIPPAFLENVGGPVPVAIADALRQEIKGAPGMTNNADTAASNPPNLRMAVGGFAVTGDIDRLHHFNTPGSGSGNFTFVYRINCVATNAATGTVSSATAVYGCIKNLSAVECSKKIT